MARTQQQRREETVARLLDASIDTIIDVGYAKASAAVIAKRARVSDGALFRHFPTMGDFMAATGREVMRRQLELFTKRVTEIPAEQPALEAVLTILRDVTGNDTNTVMYELMVAARTDEKLKASLRDMLGEYATSIYETARTVPGSEQFPEDAFTAAVAILINTFDGAAIVRSVLPQPELEGPRIALLTALLSR
ncbi:TetR/AcrR family transcriptional regulator [Mycobacterium sp. LTG2003]